VTRRATTRRTHLRRCGLVVAALAGCAGGDGGPHVSMERFAFDPQRLTVAAGATVRWTNDSDVSHTVTAYGDRIPPGTDYFASGGLGSERAARERVAEGLIRTDEDYEHAFERTGTYAYFCVPHESSGMTGTVVVE
jgi:plastocyanin